MQNYSNPASRNPISASGVEPGKVSAPQGKAPSTPSQGTGHKPGGSVAGFSGGLKPGKC